MTNRINRFTVVVERELTTLRRTRSIWLLAVVFFGLVLGVALFTEATGYVPLVLGLLTPLELLIPGFAAALGYRAILADREREEITVLRTYPIRPMTYVWGVYCGRLIVLLLIVIGSILVTGLTAPLFNSSPAGLTRHTGSDSLIFYLRFVSLTALYSAALLAVIILLSALVRRVHRGFIVTLLLVLVMAVGIDLAIILGLSGGFIGGESLSWYLALSPASAYRGLVLAFVITPVTTMVTEPVSPLISILSLSLWLVISLLIAGIRVWQRSPYRPPAKKG